MGFCWRFKFKLINHSDGNVGLEARVGESLSLRPSSWTCYSHQLRAAADLFRGCKTSGGSTGGGFEQ